MFSKSVFLLFLSPIVLDYTDPSEPDVLTLDVNNTRKCFSVNITNDNIVEGTELFYAEFNETDNNEIMIAGMSRVTIYIEDNESEFHSIYKLHHNKVTIVLFVFILHTYFH